MKKSLLFFSLFFTHTILVAQVVVTDASFPATGDTLRTATDINPSGIEITAAGGPFDWDFSDLSVATQSETVFLDASEGDVFDEVPNATHVVMDDLGESYFRVTDEKVEFLAANGNDPTGFGIASIFRFTPPILQRRAPMMFIDDNTTQSNLSLGLAWDDLPPILTDSLPIPFSPDSIRIQISNSRDDLVNAYGTLTIPGGSYEVLREKRTTITETIVEAKVPILGWQDVTGFLGDFGPVGMDTTVTYEFFSNTEKEIIASVSVDENDNPVSVTFKDNGLLSSNNELFSETPNVNISPNPTNGIANFNFSNFSNGEYELNIFGLNGKIVFSKNIAIQNNSAELINLSSLSSSFYFYSLQNNKGETIKTGKLIKQ